MHILDFAKNMEQEGVNYYTTLSKESPLRELSVIFQFLADEEKRHLEIFDAFGKGIKAPSIVDANVIQHAKDFFASLGKDFQLPELNFDYEAAYKKALESEEKAIKLYEDALLKLTDESEKKILSFIIDQEKGHARFFENMINFVREPKIWLENAEWYHLDAF